MRISAANAADIRHGIRLGRLALAVHLAPRQIRIIARSYRDESLDLIERSMLRTTRTEHARHARKRRNVARKETKVTT